MFVKNQGLIEIRVIEVGRVKFLRAIQPGTEGNAKEFET